MKVYCLTPWEWRPGFDWFRRDLGLIVDGLRAKGHDAKLLLHRSAGMPLDDERILGVDPSDLTHSSWWSDQAPDLVITLAGTRPAELPVNQAIRKAGIKLWNKMDSDGVLGASVEPLLSIYNYWWQSRYEHRRTYFPLLRSLSIHALRWAYPKLGDLKALSLFEPCDRILLETPIACARVQRFLRQLQREDLARRVAWVPGIIPEDRNYDPTIPKKNTVIAVGRWQDWHQKDTPKLFRVLHEFLNIRPDYKALVVGLADERVEMLHAKLTNNVRARTILTGRLPSEELTRLYNASRICLFTSRGEGFPNVGGEAVCCGCSIVGPAPLASMQYLTSASSGTLSWSRSDRAILDALLAEATEWDDGARNAEMISQHFRARISLTAIIKRLEILYANSVNNIPDR